MSYKKFHIDLSSLPCLVCPQCGENRGDKLGDGEDNTIYCETCGRFFTVEEAKTAKKEKKEVTNGTFKKSDKG